MHCQYDKCLNVQQQQNHRHNQERLANIIQIVGETTTM